MISMAGVIGSNAINYGATGSGASFVITLTAGADVGDLVTVAAAHTLFTTAPTSATDSRGNIYSLAPNYGSRTVVLYSVLDTALVAGDTITLWAGAPAGYFVGGIATQAVRWTGVDRTTPIDRGYSVNLSTPYGSRAGETLSFTTYAGTTSYADTVLFGFHGICDTFGIPPVAGSLTGVSVPAAVTLLSSVENVDNPSYLYGVVLHGWHAPGPAIGAAQSISWTWAPVPPNYSVMQNWWGLLVPSQGGGGGGGSGGGGTGTGGGEDMMDPAGITTSATGECDGTGGITTSATGECSVTGGVSSPIAGCE